ncbi:FAD-binding domain-containing protein [Mycena galopus ATCC 62051]|nr:FAD-binding domain-containing protein [Mycena galopus ATCC 62051]
MAGSAACALILAALGSQKVALKGSGALYTNGSDAARDAFNRVQQPSCVVFPTLSGDVQTAMRHIFENEADYAVQAGGHSMMQNWNNVQDGVLIHFAHMKNISYDSERESVTIQPGLRWNETLTYLEPFGRAVSGGRVGDVGTGLLLGGGLSHLSPQVGYSAATLREMDVVLTNGTLVTANPTNEHADLFKALKGGAQRFGIFSNDTVLQLVDAVAHYVRDIKDPKASMGMAFVLAFADGVASTAHFVIPVYNGDHLPASVFGELLALPTTSKTLGPLSYSQVAALLDSIGPDTNPQIYGASALVGSEPLFQNAFASWMNYSLSMADELLYHSLGFTTVPDSQIQASKTRGGTAFSPSDGNFAAVQFAREFPPGATNRTAREKAAARLMFEQVPPSPGKPLYINESDEIQDSFVTYGDYELLKTVYKKYDPTGFNVRHTKGPVGLEPSWARECDECGTRAYRLVNKERSRGPLSQK